MFFLHSSRLRVVLDCLDLGFGGGVFPAVFGVGTGVLVGFAQDSIPQPKKKTITIPRTRLRNSCMISSPVGYVDQ